MSFSVTSKIKLNLPVLKQLDTAQQTALRKTTDALLTRIKNSQVIPFDTGNLQGEGTFKYLNLVVAAFGKAVGDSGRKRIQNTRKPINHSISTFFKLRNTTV